MRTTEQVLRSFCLLHNVLPLFTIIILGMTKTKIIKQTFSFNHLFCSYWKCSSLACQCWGWRCCFLLQIKNKKRKQQKKNDKVPNELTCDDVRWIKAAVVETPIRSLLSTPHSEDIFHFDLFYKATATKKGSAQLN